MDLITSEQRSRLMSKIKGRNTKPEMTVRTTLHRLGYRYRLHVKGLPGSPDIVFPRKKKIILINGCFWHGHHCPKGQSVSKTNVDFWINKIKSNRLRDARVLKQLRNSGWKVLAVWECSIKKGVWLEKSIDFLNK